MAGPIYRGFGSAPPARHPLAPGHVAVGPQTRAYRQTVGSVATGEQTRAWREAHPAAGGAGAPGAPGAPGAGVPGPPAQFPTLPSGSYDPTRDVETEQGQEGLEQLEGGARTTEARDLSDYFNRQGQIQRSQGQEGEDYGRAKEQLARAFQTLAGRQGEQAEKYGVLSGGASLQSAAKRAANQQLQQQSADIAHGRRQDAFNTRLAELALNSAPPDAANPLGGREWQDLATHVRNARQNQTSFVRHQRELEGAEASKQGYEAPGTPQGGPPAAPAHKGASKAPAHKHAPPRDPIRRIRRRGI